MDSTEISPAAKPGNWKIERGCNVPRSIWWPHILIIGLKICWFKSTFNNIFVRSINKCLRKLKNSNFGINIYLKWKYSGFWCQTNAALEGLLGFSWTKCWHFSAGTRPCCWKGYKMFNIHLLCEYRRNSFLNRIGFFQGWLSA